MANKGIWCAVAYPDSADLEKALDLFRGAGAACMWILHDKDTMEDGTPKKPHWHIACGWSKGFLKWADFLDLVKLTAKDGGKAFLPKQQEARVDGSPDQLEDYFLHRDERSRKAGKHEYSPDELHKDDKWSPEDYIRAEDRRKRESDDAKKEKAHDFAFAVQIAKDNDLGEWADLVDFYSENGFDLGGLIACAYPVKAYLDSRRNLGKTVAAHVRQLVEQINTLQDEVKAYQKGKDPIYTELADKLRAAQSEATRAISRCEDHDRAVTRAITIIQALYSRTGEYLGYTDIMCALYNPERSALCDALNIK